MVKISLKIDEELKTAITNYAKDHNTTISQVIIDALKEKLGNEEDYELAKLAYDTLDRDDLKDFNLVCAECGIDYKAL